MKAEKLIYSMNDIRDEYVTEYATKANAIKAKALHHFRTWGIIAACLVLIIICTPTLIHIFNPSGVDDPKSGEQYDFSSYSELCSVLPEGNIIADIPNSKGASINIQIVSQGTLGEGERIVSVDSDVGFVDRETDLPKTFPVYVNDYAYGHEGPLYDVTDALKATISQNLSRYLGLLYDDFSSQKVKYSSDSSREYEVYYVNNATEVHSLMNSISVLSSDYDISNHITDEELLGNALVKAAVSYLNLTDPVVTQTVEYKTDGTEELRTYIVTEKTSDAFQNVLNRSFSCITVTKYADSSDVIVQISDVATECLSKHADYPALSYSDALAALTSYYPNMETANVKTEIYYSATVQPGYFFPCYRFYIKDGVATRSTNDRYTVVDVLLTDKSVDD